MRGRRPGSATQTQAQQERRGATISYLASNTLVSARLSQRVAVAAQERTEIYLREPKVLTQHGSTRYAHDVRRSLRIRTPTRHLAALPARDAATRDADDARPHD